jgi:hypothetical protein
MEPGMPNFTVTLCRTEYTWTTVEVEDVDTEEQARDQALDTVTDGDFPLGGVSEIEAINVEPLNW